MTGERITPQKPERKTLALKRQPPALKTEAPESPADAPAEKKSLFTKCRADVTVKFSEVPVRVQASHKTAVVILETGDGQQVQFAIKGKSWRKFKRTVWEIRSANPEAQWLASAGGRFVRRTNKGFILEGVGIQVFERKPRPPENEQSADNQ